MQGGEEDEGTDLNWIRQITPIETATTVSTTVNDPTIIKIVRAGKFPMRPDRFMEDVDPKI